MSDRPYELFIEYPDGSLFRIAQIRTIKVLPQPDGSEVIEYEPRLEPVLPPKPDMDLVKREVQMLVEPGKKRTP